MFIGFRGRIEYGKLEILRKHNWPRFILSIVLLLSRDTHKLLNTILLYLSISYTYVLHKYVVCLCTYAYNPIKQIGLNHRKVRPFHFVCRRPKYKMIKYK